MTNVLKSALILITSTLLTVTIIAHAEGSAPVYDADNFPPQFDGQPDAQGEAEQRPSQERVEGGPPLSASQRMARLEQRINNLQNSDTNVRVSSLQNEVQTLRGQVEDLTHKLQQIQILQKTSEPAPPKQATSQNQLEDIARQLQRLEAQQQSMSAELNKRLNHQPLSKGGDKARPNETPKSMDPMMAVTAQEQSVKAQPVKKVASIAKSGAQPNVEEEQQIYQTAYNCIKAKKYNEAVTALQNMLRQYPSGQFAANAHYWLGELYGLMNNSSQSVMEFTTVIKDYPDSPKVSNAQLKLGMIHATDLKWKEAKIAFKKVINQYPGTTSAKVAAEQLKQIKLAGH
jgi:tol-pal system protein YbgF